MKKISVSLYELEAVAPIGGKQLKVTHNSRKGALLRVEFDDAAIGYADCHPWPEIGDKPLIEQLQLLRQGTSTPLTARSLHFARLDANARLQGKNLFHGLKIPKSHWFFPNLMHCDADQIEKALQEGFAHFKIKLGSDIINETAALKQILSTNFSRPFSVRLDFNSKLSQDQFEFFSRELSSLKRQIDFCEDPFSFNPSTWDKFQQEGITLACDMNSQQALPYPDAASKIVIKPAIQDENEFLHKLAPSQGLVVTTYLDHPIGQLSAAYVAAKCQVSMPSQMNVCGLLSHHAYKKNEFSEQLTKRGPHFTIPSGNGFGYDELLESQRWSVL